MFFYWPGEARPCQARPCFVHTHKKPHKIWFVSFRDTSIWRFCKTIENKGYFSPFCLVLFKKLIFASCDSFGLFTLHTFLSETKVIWRLQKARYSRKVINKLVKPDLSAGLKYQQIIHIIDWRKTGNDLVSIFLSKESLFLWIEK